MKKGVLIIGVTASVALLTYGLWPLTSEDWHISIDDALLKGKKDYLSAIVPDTAKRPNIVIILADDLGKTDISLYGHPPITTANIDAIGHKGVTFAEGYISSPICAPSRAGLLTGRYQQRFGFEYQPHDRYPKNRLEMFVYRHFIAKGDWSVAEQSSFPPFTEVVRNGMPPSEILLSEILKARGYATGIFGKWHLGAGDHAIPSNRGFTTQYGFYEAYSLYMADTSDAQIVNQRHSDFSDPFIWGKGRTGTCAIRLNGEVIDEKYYLTDRIAEEANAFIRENADSPFFLYVPFLAPHTPFQATKAYYDRLTHIEDRNKRVYNAMIMQLDDAVGSIIAQLEALQLTENTLIIFMSDNGGATYTKATDNHPLKGGKFTNFEGGLNIPFMMRWDGKLNAGSTFAHPVIAMDVFATALEVAGLTMPSDRPMDGSSLLPHLASEQAEPVHDGLFWRSGYNRAIRIGQWKMVSDLHSGNLALYDLSTDKNEQHDLHLERPEVVEMLQQRYLDWDKGMMAPKWPRVMDFRWTDGDREFYFPL
ncbi:MAG: sulfatase-like hydrolase/transferase [Flavobacteriales bacterium]|nr:sulfatase-like hydrolase/transferase [Flavobacteriales bacterium]